jgi:N-acetylglutamate synthase-like GNAT family acetyltransferase
MNGMNVKIVPYRGAHQPILKALNVEWLNHYHLLESHDLAILDNPEKYILDRGGYIWMAELDGEAIGSAALIRQADDEFELAKMAVAPAYRGKGISKLLIRQCLEKAKETGAAKILLFSNHQLKTALGLYEKYGFKHVDVHDSPFATADVRMELRLRP